MQIVYALTLLATFAIASGHCLASPEKQNKRLSVVFTHENKKFEDVFQDFEKETGIKIEPVWIDQSDLKARLIVVAETHNTPDVVFCPSDFLGLNDYVLLSEVPDSLITMPISKENKNTVKLNGKNYGLPIISGNHLLLYYNKKIINEPAKTWAELKAQRESLPEKTHLIAWSFMEMYWFVPFITSFGGPPMVDGTPNMATPAVQAALKFVWDLAREDYIDETCGYDCSFSRFTASEVAYTINGIWSFNQFKEIMGENLGVSTLPKIGENTMQSYFSTIVAAFPHNSLNGEKSKEIHQLIKYLQTKTFQEKMWEELKDFPVHKEVLDKIVNQQDEEVNIMLKGLEEGLPMPLEKNMLFIWESMLKGFSRYGSGAMDAKDASVFMQRLTERSIER